MIKYLEKNSWKDAFLEVIPQRKGVKAQGDNEDVDDDEQEEAIESVDVDEHEEAIESVDVDEQEAVIETVNNSDPRETE
jgi:hypothetical protein